MAFVASLVIAIAIMLITAGSSPLLLAALTMAIWVIATTAVGFLERVRSKADFRQGLRALPRSFVGMSLAHIGVGVFIIGVAFTTSFSTDRDVRLAPGDSEVLAGYRFQFEGVSEVPGPNYLAQRAAVRVFKGDKQVAELFPEKRLYPIQSQPMTEAAIDVGFTRDLYVALGEPLADGSWAVRLYHKPLIRWIWLGPLIMAIGGLLAASDRRYRRAGKARRTLGETPADAVASAEPSRG